MRWLTAACVTCSSSAALVKLAWRAAASNTRSASSDGNRVRDPSADARWPTRPPASERTDFPKDSSCRFLCIHSPLQTSRALTQKEGCNLGWEMWEACEQHLT